jgi:hypothetical protein
MQASLEAKRAAALAYLGTKWCLHPRNRVPKQPTPLVLERARSIQQ